MCKTHLKGAAADIGNKQNSSIVLVCSTEYIVAKWIEPVFGMVSHFYIVLTQLESWSFSWLFSHNSASAEVITNCVNGQFLSNFATLASCCMWHSILRHQF